MPRYRGARSRGTGKRFIERIFTEREIAYAESKANRFERYAARFAAKEAGMKALGTGGNGGIAWRDFEVANLLAPAGPLCASTGRPLKLPKNWACATSRSLSHTAAQALAMVILEN